ncbi:hypothetical protein GQ457_06G044190 [Hibiscus cannabinus]
MEKFSERYCKCNPKAFTSADTAYVLAYSVICSIPMLIILWLRTRCQLMISSLYERISRNEIKMKEDDCLCREAVNELPRYIRFWTLVS